MRLKKQLKVCPVILTIDEVNEDNWENEWESTKSGNKAAVSKWGGKTGAHPRNSKPTNRTPKETKKKRKVDDFSELAGSEEVTRQKELDVAKVRAEVEKVKLEAKKAEVG